MKRIVKRIVPGFIKKAARNFSDCLYYNSALNRLKNITNKRIILIGTPEHGNLGDHLIAEAEHRFFNQYFADYAIIEITGPHYRLQHNKIISLIKESDIIAVTGGGFLGTLYEKEENMVRDLIKLLGNNKIILFPSTIYYEDSDYRRNEFLKSQKIYREHKDLTICVRDEASIAFALDLLGKNKKSKVIYAPDMALLLSYKQKSQNRSGILICLRDDKERILSKNDAILLEQTVIDMDYKIKKANTNVKRRIFKENRSTEIKKLIEVFEEAEMVITDRLHGMIFAVITGTPCIAMDNLSGKVSGVYNWISDLPYVKFADDLNEALQILIETQDVIKKSYNFEPSLSAFKAIKEAIIR